MEIVAIKVYRGVPSKLAETLDQFMTEGFKFLDSIESHFDGVDHHWQKSSFQILLYLCKYNGKYYRVPHAHIMRKGLALIARLAKKYPEYSDILKVEYGLNYDVAMIDEKQLTQLIADLDFKSFIY